MPRKPPDTVDVARHSAAAHAHRCHLSDDQPRQSRPPMKENYSMTEFQDIRIVELNDSAPGSVEGPLTSMVLQLSADTPTAWSDSFNETWKGRASVMRRAATAC